MSLRTGQLRPSSHTSQLPAGARAVFPASVVQFHRVRRRFAVTVPARSYVSHIGRER